MRLILFLGIFFMAGVCQAQSMSDQQVMQFIQSESKAGTSQGQIVTKLMQRGVNIDQIRRMRNQYQKQIQQHGLSTTADMAVSDAESRMRIKSPQPLEQTKQNMSQETDLQYAQIQQNIIIHNEKMAYPDSLRVFGRDIFNNKLLSFEPNMNIATPQYYVLGPGDQVMIDIYGASQKSESLIISPEGDITVPGFGPIHVSDLTVADAQTKIRNTLGSRYASSRLKLTVCQTRSILINVMGEVKAPGTYTLSAFATVFHALYMAGGISDLGTLRNIKVFRHGRLISKVDVYEFILNGRLAGNVRLQDNDVIQVGTYDCIVNISGKVKRPMSYEMKANESLATLFKYSGGFADNAYKKLVRVHRNEDFKSVYNVEEFDFSSFKVADGDHVQVDAIIDRYKNMVEVKGAVFRPGMYQLGDKVSSVRSLIEIASGLTEEAMTSRAVMRRMKPNRTQEVISINLDAIMNGEEPDVALKNEDVLYIPTLAEHQNFRTLTIDGEVIFPGVYEYADNMTVDDLILQAGGFTDKASAVKIDVSRRMRDPNATEAGMEISKTFSLQLPSSFVLEPYDIVQVRRSPVFQDPIRVSVSGEVAFQGYYTMEQKNQRLSDVIKSAGGVVPGSYVRGARLIRKMNEDEKARMQQVIDLARQNADGKDSISLAKLELTDTYTVGIHLDEAINNPGSTQDIELMDGDQLIVPRFNHTVRISGDVNAPNTVAFDEGKGYKYYIEQAGGFGDRAKKHNAYIVYQNGTIAKATNGKIEPGCEVIVPSKAKRDNMSVSQWLGIGTSVASLATMFATIANLVK